MGLILLWSIITRIQSGVWWYIAPLSQVDLTGAAPVAIVADMPQRSSWKKAISYGLNKI
jgi:hypothetical protein